MLTHRPGMTVRQVLRRDRRRHDEKPMRDMPEQLLVGRQCYRTRSAAPPIEKT
jgi:hypothetical protein